MVSIIRTLACLTAFASAIATSSAAFKECKTAPSSPQDRRTDTSKLKYATYNMEFLFLVGYGTLHCPGADCKWTNKAEAQKHIQQVAKIVKEMDADIIQVNEIEDCAVLEALIAEVAKLGDNTYKPYLIKGKDSSTGQNSAVITRIDPSVDLQRSEISIPLPVANSTCPSAGKAKSKTLSKHFYTTFNVEGFSQPITVVGAHLLAMPSDKTRCNDREGQATIVHTIAEDAVAQGNHVIMSGDWNDFSRTVPDRNNNEPISNVLGLIEAPGFTHAGSFADQSTRFSQWWDRNNDCKYLDTEVSTLDHIVVSDSLVSSISSVEYGNKLYEGSCSGYNSDHWPIMMTLTPQ